MIKKLFLILVSLPHIISVSAQNTVKIDKFDGSKFNFNTIKNQYHIVEATSDLNNWLVVGHFNGDGNNCLLYTSPSPRDATLSRMPSSA